MASGDTIAKFHPYDNEPPASDPATIDRRNGHVVLDFDAATNESAIFSDVLDQCYAGGGFSAYIHYTMTSAVSDTVDWDVAIERVGEVLDVDGDSFAAAQSTDGTTVPGTCGILDIVAVAFTDGAQMDSIAVGEKYRVKVTRDATSDDAAGDAEIHWVEIRET